MSCSGRTVLRDARRLLAITLMSATALSAQGRRDSLITKAKDEFVASARIQLLMAALDPAYGAPSGNWGDGVQALAQDLVDNGQDSLAATWLRWAVRLSPTLEADTVQYTPPVNAALKAAREFVNTTSTSDDTLTTTTWVWPTDGGARTASAIKVDNASAVRMEVSVDGKSPLGAGGWIEVASGSHEIRVSAVGYEGVHVTREALPETTTLLRFELRPLRGLVAASQKPGTPVPQVPGTVSHKRFPWALAVLGVAGAGAAVVLLKGKGSSSPRTGGITVTFTP